MRIFSERLNKILKNRKTRIFKKIEKKTKTMNN